MEKISEGLKARSCSSLLILLPLSTTDSKLIAAWFMNLHFSAEPHVFEESGYRTCMFVPQASREPGSTQTKAAEVVR